MKRTATLFAALLVASLAAADDQHAAGRFRGVMLRGNPDTMTEDDFAPLGRWGANLVRFQMPVGWRKPRHWESNDDYDAYIGHCLDVLQEKVLAWADAHGQKVVLDLHATSGSRTEDMENRVFLEQRYADHFVETPRTSSRSASASRPAGAASRIGSAVYASRNSATMETLPMKSILLPTLLLPLCSLAMEPLKINVDEAAVPPYEFPELLCCATASPILDPPPTTATEFSDNRP